jgi:hypothetical protein
MRIIGCDLHARQQTVAMLDTDSGELVEPLARCHCMLTLHAMYAEFSPIADATDPGQLNAIPCHL